MKFLNNLIIFCLFAACILGIVNAIATYQDVSLYAEKDTYIVSGSQTSYGSSDILQVATVCASNTCTQTSTQKISYFGFDVTGLKNVTFQEANLIIATDDQTNVNYSWFIDEISCDWDESISGADNQPQAIQRIGGVTASSSTTGYYIKYNLSGWAQSILKSITTTFDKLSICLRVIGSPVQSSISLYSRENESYSLKPTLTFSI